MVPTVTGETEGTIRCCPACRAVFRTSFVHCPNDGAMVAHVDRDPLIGQAIGPYIVDAFLGSGAVARVYRVHHHLLVRRQLALKVMLGDFTTSVAMRMRFAREAAAASRLDHPNVVPVVDHGKTDGGLVYLAMELVDGVALANLIGDRPMPVKRVLRLVRELCRGLAHAHERGLVHRDFKPENVLVVAGPDGEVPRIADFGLAISVDPADDDARLTGAGATVGTPSYAAPEQVFDAPLDERADLFALGVTMYEMLAGAVPFEGTALEVMHLNATAEPLPIGERTPGVKVPVQLEALVRKLMAPRPEHRPRTACEVLDELDRFEASWRAPVSSPALVVRPAPPLVVSELPVAFALPTPPSLPRLPEPELPEVLGATLRYYRTDRVCTPPRRAVIALAMVTAIAAIAATSLAVVKARGATERVAPEPPRGITVSPIEPGPDSPDPPPPRVP